jgi:deoxyribodipyrimidine photo-lyase
MRTLVWFRGKDLRLHDHLPLQAALADGGEIVPVFVLDPFFFEPKRARELPHRMQFLLDSLGELASELRARGSELLFVPGRSVEAIPKLVRLWQIERVVAQRWTEPFGRYRDALVRRALSVPFDLFDGETLVRPGSLRTNAGRPFAVFTPFSRALQRSSSVAQPISAPESLPPLPELERKQVLVRAPTLESLGISRNHQLLPGGESAALQRLHKFLELAAVSYRPNRDRMDLSGTSRLSQDLKFGTISPRVVWHAMAPPGADTESRRVYRNELLWREFAYSTLRDYAHMLRGPLRAEFRGFPWENSEAHWDAWVQGRTGYPVVDAAQRQLLGEGFVHNRARMVTASFLVKHLLIDYRSGEAHFLKYLTDGDWAINNLGWQWAASTGVDAQPYFRVFNPVLQGKKFDPQGDYVRRWVPELCRVPERFIHEPWLMPNSERTLDHRSYPDPIVPHAEARDRYLRVVKQHLDNIRDRQRARE